MAGELEQERVIIVLRCKLREISNPLAAFVEKIIGAIELAGFSALRAGTRAIYESFKAWSEKMRE